MAASNVVQGMYDVALKPKLLRSLLREYIPDDKHPFTNPSDLSYVVSAVKTHRLLSEWVPDSTDQKLLDSWKSAVDAWVNRLTTLTSSTMPDKVWAAICLLGLTCQECSTERFSASYSAWFNSIFSHIQTLSDSHFVRVASCASMSDLFTRLGGFPNVKKDGTSLATKLTQSLLKLLNEDASDGVLEEALCLLCTLINVFPSSVARHYDNVEASIFSRFMSENCSNGLLKKLGHGLAILPKSRGDEDSWSMMMQKVLLFLNNQLNHAFQGLEEETRSSDVVKLLLPPGKDPPPPLGGSTALGKHSDLAMKRPEQVLVTRVSTLITCCCMMLTNSYPIQVSVPVRPLIAFITRVLTVDGSLSPSNPFMTVMRHEFICSELPALQYCCLDLLNAIVKGLRSQLLPHVADITRLLIEYFRTCALPELRTKAYLVVKVLLLSMGIGVAMYLIEDVIRNAFIDLDSRGKSGTYLAAHSKASEEATQQPFHRKRKHATSTGFLDEEPPIGGLEVERSQNSPPISVRIAALEALEALLTMAGALRSDSWRSNVDHLLIKVATNACKLEWADDKSTTVYGEATPIWADLQLAALRALLASLLSPGRVRPPHLAQSLELFRKGTQETGTKISEYCSHALLTLEVLIHPRTLPMIDFQSSVDDYDCSSFKFPEINLSNYTKNIGTQGNQLSQAQHDDDKLYKRWMGNGEKEVGLGKNTSTHEEPSGTSGNMCGLQSSKSDIEGGVPLVVAAADVIAVDKDEMVVELMTQEIYKQPEENNRIEGKKLAVATGGHTAAESDRLVSSSAVSNYKELVVVSETQDYTSEGDMDTTFVEKTAAPTSSRDAVEKQSDGYDMIVGKISAALLNSEKTSATASDMEKGKGVVVDVDDDDIPDIVDGDPDSD